jgi:stage II sporulation protein D
VQAVDGAAIRDVRSGQLVANLNAQTEWLVSADAAKNLCLRGKTNSDLATTGDAAATKPVAYFPSAPRLFYNQLKFDCRSVADQSVNGYLVVPPNGSDSVVGLNGKLYRGALWLKFVPATVDGKSVTTLSAINIVEVDDYLLSVLPGEMPASWPIEALKAQAVAARSYAIANIGKHARDGYDVKATIDDQVYSGVSVENVGSNMAVAQTSGLILKHKGKAVSAFFHSTSGGATEVAENVWGRPVPYLKSVPDYDDSSPHFCWTRQIKVEDLEKAVSPSVGLVTSLIVVSRTASNRVKDALVVGTSGARFISGQALRQLFKLPSTNFNVGYKQNSYELAGRGFGHGLGMSQWGAKSLANQGYNAAQILTYYYKDVTIEYSAELPGI